MLLTKGLLLVAALGLASLSGCGEDAPVESVLRDDLTVTTYSATISGGLSNRIEFEIPFGVDSFLVEVRGKNGRYFLADFIPPNGRDLISGGKYTSRGAIEIPGLVDWLYPNDGTEGVEAGTYSLTVRVQDGASDQDIKVSVYTPLAKPSDTCGIRIDFLVDERALSLAGTEAAFARIVERMDINLRQVGIKIEDYQVQRVDMQSADIDLGNGSATSIVDDVLAKTITRGSARSDAIHALIVRRIGGTDHPNFDPAGYSMGLPGPYAANRGSSAVLVSTELYSEANSLDADGLASSLVHEIGHFLGLYHTSERNGSAHDPLSDTVECSNEFSCTDEFRRNIMTSSFWLNGASPASRNRFSEDQGVIMRGHPLCIPMPVTVIGPPIENCSLECQAPTTCAVINNQETCERACDPSDSASCETGSCESDQLGTYICTAN